MLTVKHLVQNNFILLIRQLLGLNHLLRQKCYTSPSDSVAIAGLSFRRKANSFIPGNIHRPWGRRTWLDCRTQGRSRLASSRSSSRKVRRRNTAIKVQKRVQHIKIFRPADGRRLSVCKASTSSSYPGGSSRSPGYQRLKYILRNVKTKKICLLSKHINLHL